MELALLIIGGIALGGILGCLVYFYALAWRGMSEWAEHDRYRRGHR